MANFVFNQALGRVPYYASLPAANDALVWVVLNNSGLESDATLKDYDDLAAILAAANDEHSTLARITQTASITVTVNDTDNRVEVDQPDLVWTTPAAGAQTGKLLCCYDPDTTGGTDSSLIPLVALDFSVTPSGSGNVTYQFASGGFFQAA
jgi:hypothetical protein